MFKILTALMALCAFSVQANEIKINVPIAAHHTSDREDGGKWNENFLDDVAFGVSYKHTNGLGVSINQSVNSFGSNRSVYVTADYLPTIYNNGDLFKLNVGGHVGVASGYKEMSNSGFIPLLGASVEGEVGNFSLMATVMPAYRNAPVTFIGMARFKLHEWD